MKKILFILLVALFLLIGCTQQETYVEPGKLIEYENSEMGIKIKYPENWLKQENTNNIKFTASENAIFGITATSYMPGPDALKRYRDNELSTTKMISKNLKIIESTETTLTGLPAYKIIHTAKFEPIPFIMSENVQEMVIFTIKNNKLYKIRFTTTPEDYEKYKKTIEEMIESFEIKRIEITKEVELTNIEKEICVLSKVPEYEFLIYNKVLVKKCNVNEDIIYMKDEGSSAGPMKNWITTYYNKTGNQICQEHWYNEEETCEQTLKEWNSEFNSENCNWTRICSAGDW